MIINVSSNNISDAAKVYMDSWKESHKDICSIEFIEKHDMKYMNNFISEKLKLGYNIFIDYENDLPVGIIGINPIDEEICLLYVSPEFQQKGYGAKLLGYAIKKCKNPYIVVLDTNKKAIDFYTKRGFIPDKNQPEKTEEKHIFERKYVYQNKNMW